MVTVALESIADESGVEFGGDEIVTALLLRSDSLHFLTEQLDVTVNFATEPSSVVFRRQARLGCSRKV